MNVNVLHEILGYPSKATTRMMAKEMDLMVTNTFQPCKACALGKAKKANISKTVNKRSTIARKWLFIDISPPMATSFGSKKQWLLIIDDYSDYMGLFLKGESELPEK